MSDDRLSVVHGASARLRLSTLGPPRSASRSFGGPARRPGSHPGRSCFRAVAPSMRAIRDIPIPPGQVFADSESPPPLATTSHFAWQTYVLNGFDADKLPDSSRFEGSRTAYFLLSRGVCIRGRRRPASPGAPSRVRRAAVLPPAGRASGPTTRAARGCGHPAEATHRTPKATRPGPPGPGRTSSGALPLDQVEQAR